MATEDDIELGSVWAHTSIRGRTVTVTKLLRRDKDPQKWVEITVRTPGIGDLAKAGETFELPFDGLLALHTLHLNAREGADPALNQHPVTPRPIDDSRARQFVNDLSEVGRHVEGGYSLRIERYRNDPEDAVYAILKWNQASVAGIIAWKSEAVGRAPTMADAVRDAVSQALERGWDST